MKLSLHFTLCYLLENETVVKRQMVIGHVYNSIDDANTSKCIHKISSMSYKANNLSKINAERKLFILSICIFLRFSDVLKAFNYFLNSRLCDIYWK